MPNTVCSVPGCSKKGRGHTFPNDENRRKAWVHAIRRVKNTKDQPWIPSQYSVVCRSHFKNEDYIEKTQTGIYLSFI